MNILKVIQQDSAANRGRPQFILLLTLFRLAQASRRRGKILRVLGFPIAVAYRATALTLFSIDIPISTEIGPGLSIHHGFGIVIHNRSRIGSGVTLRQCTTLGSKTGSAAPKLCDGVDVGANVTVIGAVTIGARAKLGAGSVVLKDVPAGMTAAGNPARIISDANRQTQIRGEYVGGSAIE